MNLNGVSVCPRQRVYVQLVQVHRDLRGLGIKLLKVLHRLVRVFDRNENEVLRDRSTLHSIDCGVLMEC